jgi:hypothetical protein
MKKLAIILALLMIPMTAFGMDTISDSDLDQVTGQAGVSIALTSIIIQRSGGTTGYGDVDQDMWLNITYDRTSTRTIGFHGTVPGLFDALTIDIVDLTNVSGDDLTTLVVSDDLPTSDSAVKITLCDVIQIEEDQAQIRHILVTGTADASGAAADNTDEVIAIYQAAGTTRIIGANMGPHSSSMYASGWNTTIFISAH